MPSTRSTALPGGAAIAALLAAFASPMVSGQAYPLRPIRLVVGFPPGGASDITARIVGQHLGETFGQTFIIDNRPGASGAIAASIVARAPPDGYTLLAGATSLLAINPGMSTRLGYDPVKDFAPISQTVSLPALLVVHPSVKADTLAALMSLARATPGALNYSSSGSGSSSHLAMELFKVMTGLAIVHVPFKGSGQSMPALLAGQVQLCFDPMPSSLPHVRTGKLRALAISSARRSNAMPELPTVAEAGAPGYESALWYGLLTTAGTPAAIVERLSRATNDVLRLHEVVERFAALGAEPTGTTPAVFGAYIGAEIEKWGKVIRSAGIRGE